MTASPWGKAWLTWKYGIPSRQIQFAQAYLCQLGDTIYGGSVIDGPGGLIVACSGIDSEHDEMLAGCGMHLCKGIMQRFSNAQRDVLDQHDVSFFGPTTRDLIQRGRSRDMGQRRGDVKGLDLTKYTGVYDAEGKRCPVCDSRNWVWWMNAEHSGPVDKCKCTDCGHTGPEKEFAAPQLTI